MAEARTVLLLPSTDHEVLESVERLCTDMRIGGVVLRQFLPQDSVAPLVTREGKGFSNEAPFQRLSSLLASRFLDNPDRYGIQEAGSFVYDHDWHLPVTDDAQFTIRAWLHLRGRAQFRLARSAAYDTPSGYGFAPDEIMRDSYATPVTFEPEPRDMLLFIDRGCRRSGHSTLHKVEVYEPRADRLSVAADIYLPARKATPA